MECATSKQSPISKVWNKAYYYWRILGTGLAFSLFGIGGPIIAIGLGLLLVLAPLSANTKCRISRNTIKASYKLYINFMRGIGLLTYAIKGREYMPTSGQLVIANHPSLLDVVFLISAIRDSNCIVKDGLFKNPFTRPPIKAAKFIRNNSENLMEECVSSLQENAPLIIFPEGTRSNPGDQVKFQRGAANIIIASSCEVVPVIITCSPATLLKNQKWYQIPASPPHFELTFQPPIKFGVYASSEDPQCKVARRLTKDLETYFNQHPLLNSASLIGSAGIE